MNSSKLFPYALVIIYDIMKNYLISALGYLSFKR